MAQKVTVELECDLSHALGKTMPGTTTLAFGYEGTDYEIDLCETHAAKYEEPLKVMAKSARRVTSGTKTRRLPTASTGPRTKDDRETANRIRTWANSHGYKVSDRGRIPGSVVEAYHNNTPAPGWQEGGEPSSAASPATTIEPTGQEVPTIPDSPATPEPLKQWKAPDGPTQVGNVTKARGGRKPKAAANGTEAAPARRTRRTAAAKS